MRSSSFGAPVDGASKRTLPLAMKISTFVSPIVSNSARRRSIFTVCPPTLMARRNAT